MPGSAKGVMFITPEDESANANLIVWPSVFEQNRRAILGATLMGCRGKVQKANGVIHLIVDEVTDLSVGREAHPTDLRRRFLPISDADFFGLDVTKPVSISITLGELDDAMNQPPAFCGCPRCWPRAAPSQ